MIARVRLASATAAVVFGLLSVAAWVQAQTPTADAARVSGLMASSKLKFVKHASPTNAVWTIERRGDARGAFTVVVTVKSDLLIVFVTVEQKARVQRAPELYQKLLKLSHKFDFAKIGIDDDDDVFVRIDTQVRLVDTAAIVEIVEQVSKVTDSVYLTLKPYLIVK